jgi:hypothetical protein
MAAGLFARLQTLVPEASLRHEYRRRLLRFLSGRPDPTFVVLFVIKCALHYHFHTLAREMSSGRTLVRNSF